MKDPAQNQLSNEKGILDSTAKKDKDNEGQKRPFSVIAPKVFDIQNTLKDMFKDGIDRKGEINIQQLQHKQHQKAANEKKQLKDEADQDDCCGEAHPKSPKEKYKPKRIDMGPPKVRPKSTYMRQSVEASKPQQAYINATEKQYNQLVNNMSKESHSIALVLQRIQTEKQHTEAMIAQKNTNIEGYKLYFQSLKNRQDDIVNEKREKMERECLELQENYRDQIENINVNTQIELEKLQPYMREIKQKK